MEFYFVEEFIEKLSPLSHYYEESRPGKQLVQDNPRDLPTLTRAGTTRLWLRCLTPTLVYTGFTRILLHVYLPGSSQFPSIMSEGTDPNR
jgi:hypothetical protein